VEFLKSKFSVGFGVGPSQPVVIVRNIFLEAAFLALNDPF
jgi:hypothetical protein